MFELEKETVSGQRGGERLKTCTCYCFQREGLGEKRRDTLESEEMVRQINGGKKKSWRQRQQNEEMEREGVSE